MNNLSPQKQKSVAWEIRVSRVNRKDLDIHYAGSPASAGKIARVFARDGREKVADEQARLIAAAPQLLAALERAVKLYGKEGGPWNVPGEPGSWIEQARAAVKASRG